jgi:hypothetical protein
MGAEVWNTARARRQWPVKAAVRQAPGLRGIPVCLPLWVPYADTGQFLSILNASVAYLRTPGIMPMTGCRIRIAMRVARAGRPQTGIGISSRC